MPYHGRNAIFRGRQSGQLKCLYGNPMANNVFKIKFVVNCNKKLLLIVFSVFEIFKSNK